MSFLWVRVTLYFVLYDHLMVSAIVLTATVFILFKHASSTKITFKFFRREGMKMFELWKVKQ